MTVTATATQPRPQPQAQPREERDAGHLLTEVIEQETRRLQDAASRYSVAIEAEDGQLHRAMLIASGIKRLRELLTDDLMDLVMELMNTEAGFLTDRPSKRFPQPYDRETVKTCVVAALIRGFYPTGNEINIISGKMMVVKNGYRRRLAELPGFSLPDLEIIPSLPQVANGRTLVKVAARWKFRGHAYELRDSKGEPGQFFHVATNDGSTPDNSIGKAERKVLKTIWERVGGRPQPGEDDALEVPSADLTPEAARTRTEELADRLAGRANGNADDRPDPGPSEKDVARSDDPADEPGVDLANDDPAALEKDDLASDLCQRAHEAERNDDLKPLYGELQAKRDWLGMFRADAVQRCLDARDKELAAGRAKKR